VADKPVFTLSTRELTRRADEAIEESCKLRDEAVLVIAKCHGIQRRSIGIMTTLGGTLKWLQAKAPADGEAVH